MVDADAAFGAATTIRKTRTKAAPNFFKLTPLLHFLRFIASKTTPAGYPTQQELYPSIWPGIALTDGHKAEVRETFVFARLGIGDS